MNEVTLGGRGLNNRISNLLLICLYFKLLTLNFRLLTFTAWTCNHEKIISWSVNEWTKSPLGGGGSIIELVISFWFAYILKINSSCCSMTTVRMVHSCSSWNNVLIRFYSVKECHHQNAFEQSEKDKLKKEVNNLEKISLSNALPTTLTTTKAMPTKITVTTRAVVMAVFGTITRWHT